MRRLGLITALLLSILPVAAYAQPAQNVQGVGTSSAPAGGVVSVNCVTGCGGGGGPAANVVVTAPLGTQTTAASVATTVNSSALPTGAATSALQTTGNSSLGTIATNTTNAGTPTIQAGSAIIGKVGIDQTTPGTTNGVQTISGSVTNTSPAARTIIPLDVSTVTTGGTAVTALTAGHRSAGGFLTNPKGATVDLCINEQGTASGTTSAGATTCVSPGQAYQLAATAGAVSVVTSDSSHPFSGYGLN